MTKRSIPMRISVPAEDLLDLIEEYDAWAGSMPPEDRDKHYARFAALKSRCIRALNKPQEVK